MAEVKPGDRTVVSSTCRRPNVHHWLCSGYVGHEDEPRQVCECPCHEKNGRD